MENYGQQLRNTIIILVFNNPRSRNRDSGCDLVDGRRTSECDNLRF